MRAAPLQVSVVVLLGAGLLFALWFGWDLGFRAPHGDVHTEAGAVEAPEDPILIGSGGASSPEPTAPKAPTTTTADAPASADPEDRYVVRGVVQDADRKPVAHMQLRLEPRVNGVFISTGADGRFKTELPAGHYRLISRAMGVVGSKPFKAKVLEFESEDEPDLEFVLEVYPYVYLLFVGSEDPEHGPHTTLIQVIYEEDGVERLASTSSWSQRPGPLPPFRTRYVHTQPKVRSRLQVRAQGYAPSPWIDAPTYPQAEPRTIALRTDPASLAHVTIDVRTDTGEALTHVEASTQFTQFHALEDGAFELERSPGAHRIDLAPRSDRPEAPEEPCQWYLPVTLEVVLERGAAVRRMVTLTKGGFVELVVPGEELSRRTARFAREDEAVEFDVGSSSDIVGPLAQGTWTYRYMCDEVTFEGKVDVIAGEVAKATPARSARHGADDDG